MALRCNICSLEIGEDEVESHVATQKHLENKERLAKAKDAGSDESVVRAWKESL